MATKTKIKKTPENSNAGEDVEQVEFSIIASRNIKWYSYSGKQLAISYRTKNVTTTQLNNCIPDHLS